MPTFAYKNSTVYENVQGNTGYFIIFPLLILYLRFVYSILFEKEIKAAQNLRNMGMSMVKFYMSWYLFYTIIIAIYALIFTLISKRAILPDADFVMYYLLYFITGMYFISLGLFVTSFFSKAKPGVLCAIIFFFVLFGVGIAKSSIESKSLSLNTWLTLSPIAALTDASNIMLLV